MSFQPSAHIVFRPSSTASVARRNGSLTTSEAVDKAKKAKSKYDACKKKRGAKGAYPEHPGKGPFFMDCRADYRKWKKYAEIAGPKAMGVGQNLYQADPDAAEAAAAAAATEATTNTVLIPAIGFGILVVAFGAYVFSRRR